MNKNFIKGIIFLGIIITIGLGLIYQKNIKDEEVKKEAYLKKDIILYSTGIERYLRNNYNDSIDKNIMIENVRKMNVYTVIENGENKTYYAEKKNPWGKEYKINVLNEKMVILKTELKKDEFVEVNISVDKNKNGDIESTIKYKGIDIEDENLDNLKL